MCPEPATDVCSARQQGFSLILVMVVLVIVAVAGAAGAQLALLNERGSRSDRDVQLAFQSAEAALYDAGVDIEGTGAGARGPVFSPDALSAFLPACGDAGPNKGLCAAASDGEVPAWMAVDFLAEPPHTAVFGDFTGARFDASGPGIKPAAKPRYVIEPVPFYELGQSRASAPSLAYRVTAMGFGARRESQVVLQMVYRKE